MRSVTSKLVRRDTRGRLVALTAESRCASVANPGYGRPIAELIALPVNMLCLTASRLTSLRQMLEYMNV